jgi:hypothetical protein
MSNWAVALLVAVIAGLSAALARDHLSGNSRLRTILSLSCAAVVIFAVGYVVATVIGKTGDSSSSPPPTESTAPSPSVPAPANLASSSPSISAGPPTLGSCPSLAEAQQITGMGGKLAQISEYCGFAVHGNTVAMQATCPSGWICTFHLTTYQTIVALGPYTTNGVDDSTWRFIAAYPFNDAVRAPCQLVQKESSNAGVASPANFTCPQ